MKDFTEHVVVVSGAAGNLGGAVAHAFDAAGAKLGLLDRRPDRLQQICGTLANEPEHTLLGTVNMTDEQSVREAIATVIEAYDHIDILVNAIGGFSSGTPVSETPLEVWDKMIDLNAKSAFLACREVVPHMMAQGRGRIINVAARPGIKGPARSAAYAASKSAVIRLTESLSAEVKSEGVNVNCVLPGTIDTPQNRDAMPTAQHDRWVRPESVAEVIKFLASDASDAIHGASIPVYGTG
jgi:NAD(P)-dependent dehydrogenase (short-subunit alcohol dehydrogenase family)